MEGTHHFISIHDCMQAMSHCQHRHIRGQVIPQRCLNNAVRLVICSKQ